MIITDICNGRFQLDDTPNQIDPTEYVVVYDFASGMKLLANKTLLSSHPFVYSNFKGCYVLLTQMKNMTTLKRKMYFNTFGNGDFPYPLLTREYEATYNIDFLSKYTKLDEKLDFEIAKHVDYTFGVEFETSAGYIPEDKCFEYGLIPLRDGSISGIEYSTIVLKGNSGFNLLSKQLKLLNQYTTFNKECALHIHFGGFPLNKDKILLLNNMFSYIFSDLELVQTLPIATFHTDQYKKNKKSYCELNLQYANFNNLYRYFVGTNYMGSLTQPHPCDLDRAAKWNIHSRYVACNLVNMLCYTGPKTVEFRFLRPTKNLDVILFWIYTLNAIMKCAEKGVFCRTIKDIYTLCYPTEIVDCLMDAIVDLIIIRNNQLNNGDNCNAMYEFENNFKLNTKLTCNEQY